MYKYSRPAEPVHVGGVCKDLLEKLGLEKRFLYDQAMRSWSMVVGDRFSSHSRALRVENGKIIVSVDDPSVRQEMHFESVKILSKINQRLGKEIIKGIILR